MKYKKVKGGIVLVGKCYEMPCFFCIDYNKSKMKGIHENYYTASGGCKLWHKDAKEKGFKSKIIKPVNGGKDGNTIKTLLKTFTEEEFKTKIDLFMIYDDPWMSDKPYDIGMFKSQINKLKVKPKKPASQFKPGTV